MPKSGNSGAAIVRSRLIAVLLIGAAMPAMAVAAPVQSSATPGAAPAGELEAIVVTGSRITGVAPVGSPLEAISRSDVQVSSVVTTTQLLQQIPQVFNLGISESSRGQSGGSSNITYGSSVNLRGIGPFTTLVLVDGHRAVPQGTSGFAVDPSIVPTIALERVEIVADGSSAIYGSDAIAGVVNLIRRRQVDHAEATARYGWGDNYNERQFSVIAGHHWDSGRMTLAFENGFHSALSGKDRAFFAADLRRFGGGDFRPTLCSPGNIVVSGVTYPIPAGGVTAANRSALVPGAANACDNLKYADLIPRQNRNSLSATFDQSLGDRVSIFGDALLSKRTFKLKQAAATATVTVPSSNAFFVAPPGLNPASETVQYSFINDYQPFSEGFSETYEATLGGRVKLGAGWKAEGDFTYGRDEDRQFSHNLANAAAQTAALASNNPATALNVFGGGSSPTAISNILIGRSEGHGRTNFRSWEAKLDGPVMRLPGGEIRVALGYEGQRYHVVQNPISGTTLVPISGFRPIDRSVDSGYGEVLIPLFSSENARPGFRRLDIDLAGRYDSYNDVGSTSNPKVGVTWSPASGVSFRGSYGASFRAPTIAQIYGNSNSLFVQNVSDPTCSCIRQSVARSGSNLSLRPETATTWTIGGDFEPDFLPRSKFSLTYFDVNYENQVVAYLSDLTIIQRESQFAGTGIITRNPSAAFIQQQLAETGFTGVLPNPVLIFVDGRNFNLGTTIARGLDFQASYRVLTDNAGQWGFGVNGTYFTDYKVSITPTAPLLSFNNKIYNPLRFKARGSVSWSNGPILVNAFLNYQNAYINNLSTPVQKVGAYTTIDLRAAYRFGGPGPLKDFTIAVDARNLFDKDPPFVNIAQSPNGGGGFDATLTNPVGRLIAVSLSKTF